MVLHYPQSYLIGKDKKGVLDMIIEQCALSETKCEGMCRAAHRELEKCPCFYLKKEEKKVFMKKRYRAESAVEEDEIFKG